MDDAVFVEKLPDSRNVFCVFVCTIEPVKYHLSAVQDVAFYRVEVEGETRRPLPRLPFPFSFPLHEQLLKNGFHFVMQCYGAKKWTFLFPKFEAKIELWFGC